MVQDSSSSVLRLSAKRLGSDLNIVQNNALNMTSKWKSTSFSKRKKRKKENTEDKVHIFYQNSLTDVPPVA